MIDTKKQYTLENCNIYGTYIKVVLHSNNKKSKIISSTKLNNCIKSLEKNGWTRGYTKRDLKEAKERIESFERSIISLKSELEIIESNLVKELGEE